MAKYIPLILFTVLTNAAAQIVLKKGMLTVGGFPGDMGDVAGFIFRTVTSPMVFAGLCIFVISMASHLIVLSKVELSYAYPFLSLAYVVVAVYAYYVFREDLGTVRIAGIALICAGTILISQS